MSWHLLLDLDGLAHHELATASGCETHRTASHQPSCWPAQGKAERWRINEAVYLAHGITVRAVMWQLAPSWEATSVPALLARC